MGFILTQNSSFENQTEELLLDIKINLVLSAETLPCQSNSGNLGIYGDILKASPSNDCGRGVSTVNTLYNGKADFSLSIEELIRVNNKTAFVLPSLNNFRIIALQSAYSQAFAIVDESHDVFAISIMSSASSKFNTQSYSCLNQYSYNRINLGMIIGIVVGGLVIITVIILILLRKKIFGRKKSIAVSNPNVEVVNPGDYENNVFLSDCRIRISLIQFQ